MEWQAWKAVRVQGKRRLSALFHGGTFGNGDSLASTRSQFVTKACVDVTNHLIEASSVPYSWGTYSYCAKTRVVIRNYALRS